MPVPTTTPDQWARDNRKYKSTAGVPGPREPSLTPYIIPFVRRVHDRQHARVVEVTASQSGKTDGLLDCIGARVHQNPVPILYVGPSKEFVSDQFEPRLRLLFDQAASLAARVVRGQRSKKLRKIVNGVPIRMGYAGSSTSLKSDPAGFAIVDEYDEMSANIKGQGDPLGLVEARGETYADFSVAITSTPGRGVAETETDPVSGLTFWKVADIRQVESPIWRLFQQGTRHHYAWPCPHCGEYFVPMFMHLRWPKGATPAQAKAGAYLQCPQGCADPILEEHKEAMNAAGIMIAPGQTIAQAMAGEDPPNSTWSCWTSGLCSPFVTWGDSAERYLTAFTSGEEDKIQTVMNARFGQLYTPGTSGDLPAWQQVLAHRGPADKPFYPRGTCPPGVIRVVSGIDVQKRSLIYVVRGFGSLGTSWLIDHGQFYGLTDQPGGPWDDLATMLTTPIDGMLIERAFIDSGFRPDKPDAGDEHRVYAFAHRWSYMVNATKGRDILNGKPFSMSQIEVKPDGSKNPYSIDLVHINTDFFKGLVHSRIKTELDQPGAFFLHAGADEDYARQIVSEARVLGEDMRPSWVRLAKDNHFLDAEALAAAAAYTLNVQTIPAGVQRMTKAVDGPGDKAPPKPAVVAGKAAIMDKFRNMGMAAKRQQ